MRAKIIFSLIICLLIVGSSFAEPRSHPQFEIEIANIDSTEHSYPGVIQGTTVSVPIIVNKATHKISGFDFCVEYDPRALMLLSIEPGSYLTGDYKTHFGYEIQLDSGIIIDTINSVQITGIWCSVGGNNSPPQYVNFDSGDTLAVMNFLVTTDLTLECQSLPIEFYFNDCTDNIVYSWPAEKVYYPRQVFSYDDSLIIDFENAPPFYNDDCNYSDSDRGRGFNKSAIDYKNGRVKIICIMDIDDRCVYGDYNGNGMIFEVADLVLFQDIYFGHFLNDIFAPATESSCMLHVADFNDDGEYLTIEDFVYFIRYFTGGDIPIDQIVNYLFKGNLKIRANETKITVNSRFEIDAGAVHLCFYAPGQISNITLSDDVSHMNIKHAISDDTLKILIYSYSGPIYGTEKLSIPAELSELVSFEYAGEQPTLAYASAAGYYGEKIDLQTTENSPFSIKIGKADEVIGGTDVSLPVSKLSGKSEMYGFDFLISYDNSALAFMGAYENSDIFDIPGEYEWEYFTYSFDYDQPSDSGYQSGLLRFIGIANQKGSSHVPKSLYIPDNTTLFTLEFLVSNNMTYMGEFLPVSFFWKGCSDNAIRCKGAPGNPFGSRSQIALSNRVFDSESRYNDIYYEITDKNCGFPTSNGAQDDCFDNINSNRFDYVPYIDFYNGGIKLIDCGCVDDRGDINLNGIAYEVADAMIFVSYFMYGTEVFAINVYGQTAASDVNADGIPLTIEDLVHFIRIIVGEVLPNADPKPVEHFDGELQFQNGKNMITVGGEFEKLVGAIHLCFYAPDQIDAVTLTDESDHMAIAYTQKDDSLKIVIYSFKHYALPYGFNNIVNIEYSGEKPEFAYASVGGHKSEKVDLEIVESVPFEIKIGKIEDQYLGQHAYIPVVQTDGDAENYGFDFLISYDNSELAFMGAFGDTTLFNIPGEYEWEYFTYRFVNNCENCPSGLLQIIGIADRNDGAHQPLNMNLPDNMTLFTMDFMITNDYTLEGQFLPIDFFWRDCTDNSIAAILGGNSLHDITAVISQDVYSGFDSSIITDKLATFPTFFGAPDECVDVSSSKKPVRFIDFYNGGIKIAESGYITNNPDEIVIPVEFELAQNYPNPFNPNTEIKFGLPRSSDVTLNIFDITGRKVTTLINKKLSAGPHAVIWNGRDESGKEVSTGIYLYRINAGDYSDTKKMLLLK